jgi:hypothetical protein
MAFLLLTVGNFELVIRAIILAKGNQMTSNEIFDALGGPNQVARLLGIKMSTSSQMKKYGVFPVKHWDALIEELRKRKVKNVSYGTFVQHYLDREAAK